MANISNKRLTVKQEKFVNYIFQGLPQREAYIKAGYSSKMLPSTIDHNASVLANDNKVLTRIAELKAKLEEKSVATVQERKQRATEIIRSNLTDYVSEDGTIILKPNAAIAEYTVTETQAGENIINRKKTIKLRNPLDGIDILNKMEGAYADEKPVLNDNRSIHFHIEGETAKKNIEKLLSGER